jgi:hypothetical protein
MIKHIELRIKSIVYAGDSIGDDIRIEVGCLDKFIVLNKRLKNGDTWKVDAPIGIFFRDTSTATFPVTLSIIDRDLVFNDVGSTDEKIKVDLTVNTTQQYSYKIEVRERRNYLSRQTAIFNVTIESTVSDALHSVLGEKDGWIVGRDEDTKKNIPLVSRLRVQLERSDTKRQYFLIKEGVLAGSRASLRIEAGGKSHLETGILYLEPLRLTYSLSKHTLRLKNDAYLTKAYPNDPNPWKKGVYDIEIPDAPHRGGVNYIDKAKLAKVWFRIGHSGERYLHVGSRTLGCVTVIEIEQWDDLCRTLLLARKNDGQSIGTLTVID